LDFLNLAKALARSPRQLYAICKRDDGLPNDEGTTLNAIFKALRDVGVSELAHCPNDIHLPKNQYRDAARITPAALIDASKNRTGSWAFLSNVTLDVVKRAIWQNQAVILLIYCDNGFFGTTTPTFKEKSYGHFVVAYGYDEDGVYVADSTEATSAFSYKYIPRAAFDNGFIRQGATAVNIPNWQLIGLTSPNAVKRFVLTQLITLYTQVLKGRP